MEWRSSVPNWMHGMVLDGPGRALRWAELPVPRPGPSQVLLRVAACGVCRTDLHIVDGELEAPKLPLVLGHEVVGIVVGAGEAASRFNLGDRVGVPWLGRADGTCPACRRGQENLCDHPAFTGYTVDGGYAEYAVADERFCFSLPARYTDTAVAPLLCAGLIGYRSYRLTGEHVERLGLYGFGAAAHLLVQVAVWQGKRVYAFTRPGDGAAQAFAQRLGVIWSGGSDELPPEPLDAALIFAPVGPLVVEALRATAKGGTVVCGGIHMSDIPSFPYRFLWQERSIRSVANLTRRDGDEFLAIARDLPLEVATEVFGLDQANHALARLRQGQIQGAAVLVP